jgi:hypothetical protein
MSKKQWEFDSALRRCSITARRVYFLLASGETYNRDPSAFAQWMTEWAKEHEVDDTYDEYDIIEAYAELRKWNLLDEQHRPRMMYDIQW